jgi:eukaryotic-like serine/threonine-protein kinase
MTPERWKKIEQLCSAALDRDASQRGAFLLQACQGDDELRREVESLLQQEKPADRFLESSDAERAVQQIVKGRGDGAEKLVGKRLGSYQIVSQVGAGGMGEVYRARDTRLDRTVAIKILPERLAERGELRERFEREARTIASLNHPHICTLYDVGREGGTDYLVMEFVEGETLAERLKKGALPVEQVLRNAIEIADALDKAHRKGITHRDLKPGNIMLTKSGAKLLDFGLAKLRVGASPGTPLSELPTEKSDVTATGTILGTLQYMAPEQLEGKEADGRTDIFAFGAVVYEMATGRKAFEGKSQASLIAKILETEPPPISSLQPMTPPTLDRLVRRCLAKDPDERWQSAADLCEQLRWIADSGPETGRAAGIIASPRRSPSANTSRIVSGVAIGVALIAVAAFFLRRTPRPEKQVVRFTVGPPEQGSFTLGNVYNYIAVSPDGSKLAFVASAASRPQQLWIRALDSSSAQALPGTENATFPFWSPDGRFIGFSAGGKLKKVALSGGSVETLADVAPTPGTWSPDGVILFAGDDNRLLRVSESGGTATPVTSLDSSRSEAYDQWPQFLPDGKHFLYFAESSKPENNAIFAASLDSKDRKLILKASSNAVYVSSGYLVFNRQGTLMAQPFDADRLELTGEAVPIAEGVGFNPFGSLALFSASNNGVLAYRQGGGFVPLSIVWVSRNGVEQPLPAAPHNYTFPRISPDGKRIAAGIEEEDGQIWLYDIARDVLSRLTFEGPSNVDPVWTPDGKRITFKGKENRLFWQLADGGGSAEEVTKEQLARNNIPSSWSPDGQQLVFLEDGGGRSVWILPLKDRTPRVFMEDFAAYTSAPCFSPDGRWIAYTSNESGRTEIYVRPYPGPGGKWQISTEGGTEPLWNPRGRELFYRNGRKMMAVDYTAQPSFSAGKPRMLFQGPYTITPRSATDYDVSPDGQRFLMLKPAAEQAPGQINVVLNWPEELKQKAASGKQR